MGALGTRSPLPVEVAPFGWEAQERFLRSLGCTPTRRMTAGQVPFVTDNGNFIFDCRFSRIDNPAELEETLRRRAGVVATGLFIGMASMAILGDEQGVRELTP